MLTRRETKFELVRSEDALRKLEGDDEDDEDDEGRLLSESSSYVLTHSPYRKQLKPCSYQVRITPT